MNVPLKSQRHLYTAGFAVFIALGNLQITEKIKMPADAKVKGPASYFPSIEKKYGQPIAHWLTLVGNLNGMKHMEMVNWLKTEHNIGHGHANAIVAHYLASSK